MNHAVLLGILAAVALPSAEKCRCGGTEGPENAFSSWHPAVFVGEVLPTDTSRARGGADPHWTDTRVRALRAWKGAVRDSIIVVGSWSSDPCEYPLRPGTVHLLYTWTVDPTKVSLCSRSRLLAAAGEDLDFLGPAIGESTDQLEVFVTPETSRPLPYAHVSIQGNVAWRSTDAAGRAVFNRIRPGIVVVRVTANKGSDHAVDSALVEPGRAAVLRVTVKSSRRSIPTDSLRYYIDKRERRQDDGRRPIPWMNRGGARDSFPKPPGW